jgi:hypothetical protein
MLVRVPLVTNAADEEDGLEQWFLVCGQRVDKFQGVHENGWEKNCSFVFTNL